MNEVPPPLARTLTSRLAWIAVAVVIINALAVGAYYGSDTRALEGEVIEQMMPMLESGIDPESQQVGREERAIFETHPEAYAFAILGSDNRVIDSENSGLIPEASLKTGTFAQDWITRQQTGGRHVLIASQKALLAEQPIRIVFVMTDDPAGLLRKALVAEFVTHIWLPILPTALLLIAVNALMIRRGIRPVVDAARWARSIKPGSPAPPLADRGFPREIVDLVTATHLSLDRLNEALAAEKRRTAEAAHALRTPVSVLFARLDGIPEGTHRDHLRAELSALSRTVNQLLACARADELTVPDTCRTDLGEVASRVTAALAPFAYEHRVTLSLQTQNEAVIAKADPDAVELALTNLVENAILHGGAGEVEIAVGSDATLSVSDQGPGLSPIALDRMFELFWRDVGAPVGGSGLGLAIVSRLQAAQRGSVRADNSVTGGAVLVLYYRLA
jgi:two-component system OmpR family sensor kinase